MKLETTEGSYGHYIGIRNVDTGKQVAQVKWGPGDGDLANLFCAAPELLAALSDAILWVHDEDQGALEYKAKWRAVIAKARGK